MKDFDNIGTTPAPQNDDLWSSAGPSQNGNEGANDSSEDPDFKAANSPVGAKQPCPCTPKSVEADPTVDVDRNDLLKTAGAIVNLPLALLLRGVAGVVPEFGDMLKAKSADSPMQTKFGTGDHSGIGGFLFGDNSATDDTGGTNPNVNNDSLPGVLGIAMGLAHAEGIWGNTKVFEDGQLCHNLKTGKPDATSSVWKSAGDTLGEGFGVIARHLGVGSDFYDIIHSTMGDSPKDYGFVSGVRNGAGVLPTKENRQE